MKNDSACVKFSLSLFLFGATILLHVPFVSANESTASLGIESRTTYTRWFEYPGSYYEETFSLQGIRGEYYSANFKLETGQISLGYTLALYALGSYDNGWDGDENPNAWGVRPGLISQYKFDLQPNLSLIAQAELTYLILFGEDDARNHADGVGVYFPALDAGLGLAFNNLSFGSISSIRLLYTFSAVDLGVTTDNFIRNTPDISEWSNNSLVLMANF